MDRKNKGEIHLRPAVSKIGPRIKGIRLSADDKIKLAIRQLKTSDQQEFDTFKEADDFDVEDDIPDPTSPFEMSEMQEDHEFQEIPELDSDTQRKQEQVEEEAAPEEAPTKGAAEQPSP